MGKAGAMLLTNLLGHFPVTINYKPADQYIDNEIITHEIDTIFYFGSTYDVLSYYANSSPEYKSYIDFFQDVIENNKKVVWINYNLNFLIDEWNNGGFSPATFEQASGFSYHDVVTSAKYNRVRYKNTELYKGVIPFANPGTDTSRCIAENNQTFACETELNYVEITNPNKAKSWATAYSTLDDSTPEESYVTHGGRFWFVGDSPFYYMCEEDRYLVFSDLLHNMLGIDHSENHVAIMRLEDIDARTRLEDLTAVANYMRSQGVPFNVATIPQYNDPYGVENDGLNTVINLSESKVGDKLREYYRERLIDIIQHGHSHQLYDFINPYNGISGDDFEFMIVTDEDDDGDYVYERPSEDDDGDWALDRMMEGKRILEDTGLRAFAWEAPHYMAGPNHYRAIKQLYPVQYARVIYYPLEDQAEVNGKYEFIGQFFPYIIRRDLYGQYIIPENIHNVIQQPNPGYRSITPQDIIRFSRKLKVVRDGVASFYYHAFLGIEDLSVIVPGIRAEGYNFVRATTLVK